MMKTRVRDLSKLLSHLGLLMMVAAAMVGCAKKDTQTATVNAGYYRTSDGLCYSASNGQRVADNLCVGTNGYYYANGQCYGPGGQPMNANYCSGSQYGTYGRQVCNGNYLYASVNGWEQVQCYQTYNGTSNCSGYTLYSVAGNTQVTCQ